MAEHFNQCLTSTGENLEKSIPKTKIYFFDYLNDQTKGFLIQIREAEEVKDSIMTLIGCKRTGTNTISTKSLKAK